MIAHRLPYFALVITLTLAVTACSTPSWMGATNEKKLEGERVVLLDTENTLEPDANLAKNPIHLPHPRLNTRWYKSTGQHVLSEQNPRAPWDITDVTVIDAGEGSAKSHPISVRPVIAAGRVFLLDTKGVVSAYEAENPSNALWKTIIDVDEKKARFNNGGMAYHQNKLYVNSGYNLVLALDIKTGEPLWKKSLAGLTRAAPDARNGVVYVQTLDNRLYALNDQDGAIIWIYEGIEKNLTQYGGASPVAVGEAVISAHSSGEMHVLKSFDGKRVWSDSLTFSGSKHLSSFTDIDATPIVSEGRIYTVGKGGLLASFELFTGTRVWEREFSSSADPWLAADFLYALSDKGELAAFYTLNGGIKWVTHLPLFEDMEDRSGYIQWSGPVMAGSRLLLVGSHGKLLSISPIDGQIIHEQDVPEDIYVGPVIAYDKIYLYDNDAQLTILSGPPKIASQEDFFPQGTYVSDEEDNAPGVISRGVDSVGSFFGGLVKSFRGDDEEEQIDNSADE